MLLRIERLCKSYQCGIKALDNVSLRIPAGLFGLLGSNGAGKSTLMRTLATLQNPDSGDIFFNDINVLQQKPLIRSLLGYLPQDFGVYPRTSALDLLNHIATLKGMTDPGTRRESVTAMLQQVQLYNDRNRAVETFSGGMKRRFGIAQALLGNPRLLIVDEPTAGLDPAERNRFCDMLTAIGEQAVVILSTHLVHDVQQLCPNMALIECGRILYAGPTTDAVNRLQSRVWKKSIHINDVPRSRELFQVISTRQLMGRTEIVVFSDTQPDDDFMPCEADLETYFFWQSYQSGRS
jgi:ABC-type multidrug transport system ATPase subunit